MSLASKEKSRCSCCKLTKPSGHLLDCAADMAGCSRLAVVRPAPVTCGPCVGPFCRKEEGRNLLFYAQSAMKVRVSLLSVQWVR